MNQIKFNIKYFVHFSLIYFPFLLTLGQTISQIDVIGNNIITKETIIENINFKIGDDFTEEIATSKKKTILNGILKNHISDINFNLSNKLLTITVEEKKIVQNINFEGIPFFYVKMIESSNLIKTKQASKVSLAEIKQDAKIIESIIKNHQFSGSLLTKVEYELKKLNENEINVIFKIKTSNKSQYDKISFTGNYSYSDEHLKSQLSIQAQQNIVRNFFLKKITTYEKTVLNQEEKNLENFYKNEGFLDVKVFSSYVTFENSFDKINVNFCIIEGAKYSLGKIKFLSKANCITDRALEKLLSKYITKKIKISSIKFLTKKLNHILYQKGYKDCILEHQFKDTIGFIKNVEFILTKKKKNVIRKITIKGNTKTEEELIRSIITISEGNSYSQLDLEKSKDQLESTKFFNNVQFTISGKNEVDILITLEETSQLKVNLFNVSLSPSKKSIGVNVGFGFLDNNFLGKGIATDFAIDLARKKPGSKTEQKFSTKPNKWLIYSKLNFDFPYLLNSQIMSPFLKLKYKSHALSTKNENNRISLFPYISPGLNFLWHQKFNTLIQYNITKYNLINNTNNEAEKKDKLSTNIKSTNINLKVKNTYSTLNSLNKPIKGIFIQNSNKFYQIFSQRKKLTTEFELKKYHSILNKHITFCCKIEAGLTEINDKEKKFYLDIPGFEVNDDDNNIGKIKWSFINELRLNIAPESFMLSCFAYFACGDVFDNWSKNNNTNNKQQTKYSFGIGLRIPVPMSSIVLRVEKSLISVENANIKKKDFKISFENNF